MGPTVLFVITINKMRENNQYVSEIMLISWHIYQKALITFLTIMPHRHNANIGIVVR